MKKITIEDVAREAGVSVATVSRVLNNYPHISKKAKLKVEAAIKKLNYHPSTFAQRLAGKSLKTIALVMPSYEGMFYSFYGNEIVRSVGDACIDLDYDLLLHISSSRRSLNFSSVDGVLFADIIENVKELQNCIEEDKPCVVINREVSEYPVSFVAINNKQGAKEAVQYLISLGHTKIAHITGDLRTQCARQRLEGYKEALLDANINVDKEWIKIGNFSRISARRAAEQLLFLKNKPTAIFCASDDMAQEAIFVINEHNLRVPEDISIIGFDDSPLCVFGPISISSVRQPLREMTRRGMEILESIISGDKEIKKEFLPCRLVIRESCDFID